MIAFRYCKTEGAEYLSHLDLLRHVYRTLRRAGIPVEYSNGYHAHPRIFLNNPLPVGVKSVAEYGAIETGFAGDFKSLFNEYSPVGVKCLDYRATESNPNYAGGIERCTYDIYGLAPFDPAEVLGMDGWVITDLRGREVDIRPRIYGLQFCGGVLTCTLGCGNDNLRPDLFAGVLASRFGGAAGEICKTESLGKGVF